jgi:hypothetical protein
MPQSTTIAPLHRRPFTRPSFVQLHFAPLWQRTLLAAAFVGEVWVEARALERQMLPHRLGD